MQFLLLYLIGKMIIVRVFLRLFSIRFYSDIVTGTQRFNPFLSLLLLSLVWVVNPAVTILTQGYVFAQGFESQTNTLIERIFPEDLEIKINKGMVTTNVVEPYYITVSPDTFKGTFLEDKNRTSDYKRRLLAIDTKGRAEEFERYQAAALLTERSVVYYNDNNIRIQPLRESDNIVVNKKGVLDGFHNMVQKARLGTILRVGVFVLPVLLLLMMYAGQWILLLWYALLVWFIIKIYFPALGYGRSIKYTAAVSFIPTIVVTLVRSIPHLPYFISEILSCQFIFILTFAYWGVYWAARLNKKEELS